MVVRRLAPSIFDIFWGANMKIFETNATVIGVVSAVGQFVIGCTMPTLINAQKMNAETEVDIIPPGEPKDITKTTNLTR